MTPPLVASIVEGHGEEEALPKLLYNIVLAVQPALYPIVLPPHRVPRDSLLNVSGALEDYAVKAVTGAGPTARLLVLIDADDDDPTELEARLLQRVPQHIPATRVSVCVAVREYESWFIASLETIAPLAGIANNTRVPESIEAIRGAKEWLSMRMPRGQTYKPTLHQAEFSSALDIGLARLRSQSFDRLCAEVQRLLTA
jgi:hypothetical protein